MAHKQREYKTIDEQVAKTIEQVRRRHPNAGQARLFKLLQEKGIEVDPRELRRFLRQRAQVVRARGQVARDRNVIGLPSSIFGGPPELPL